MAFNAGTAEAQLTLKIDKFQRELRQARSELDRLSKRSQQASKATRGLRNNFAKAALAVGGAVAGILAARAAFNKLSGAISNASRLQQQYESSVQKLGAALVTTGERDVASATANVEALAFELQRSTKFGDRAVVDVASSLAAFGATGKDLERFTRATIDAAAAFNLDLNTAARSFGQALAGNAATLGRYIPAVRGLTQEQLKAGGAFKLAETAAGGFAKALGTDAQARFLQLAGTVDDIRKRVGAAFNDIAGPLANQLRIALDGIELRLRDGTEGFSELQDAAATGFQFVVDAINFVVEGILRLRVVTLQITQNYALFQQVAVQAFAGIFGGIAKLREAVQLFVSDLITTFSQLPFVSDGVKESLEGAAEAIRQSAERQGELVRETEVLVEAAKAVTEERRKATLQAVADLEAVRTGTAEAGTLLGILGKIRTTRVQITEEEKKAAAAARQEAADRKRAADAAAKRLELSQKRLAKLREINGVSGTAGKTAQQINEATAALASNTERAAGAAQGLASSFQQAASAAGQAASAAGQASAAAGGGGGIPIRRGTISSTSLDFSDPFRASGLASQARAALGRVGSGGFRADLGAFTVRAARATADSIAAEARASIERALGQFSSEVVSELNQRGIFDPAERNRILRERIAEAQRLGLVPRQIEGTFTPGI